MSNWEEMGLEAEVATKLTENGAHDLQTLASNYIKAQDFISSTPRVPGASASEEDVARYRRAIGVPEQPNGYEIQEGIPDFREDAHEAGLTAEQFARVQGVMAAKLAELEESRTSVEGRREAWQEKAQAELGDSYEEILAKAVRASEGTFSEEELAALKESGLDSSPSLMKLLAAQEDKKGILGNSSQPLGNKTDVNRRRAMQIVEIMGKPDFQSTSKPGYQTLYAEYMRLTRAMIDDGFSGIDDPRLGVDNALSGL